MTSPITPNPAIHVQPKDIGAQQELFTAGQLQTWAQELPLAMTLDLVDAILRAFGATQAEIDIINQDYTTYYDNVESWLTQSNADTQAFFNSISAALQQSWMSFQNLINGIVQQADADVAAAVEWLQNVGTDTTNIIDSFAPGGTSTEFLAGVTNLLALFGLTPADIGGATVIDTVWTDVINDIINPLNALEISAINGLSSALSALLGTTTFQTLLDSVANALGHSGTGHTITNIETYLGLIPPANVTNVLGGANLGADVSSVHTTATNGAAWVTRLTNDLLVTSDVFHLIYPVGTSTDPPGTTSGGKPTWYSCWNDLLALTGTVNSVTAPTDAAPAVAAAVNTAQSGADTANANAGSALMQLQAVPAQVVVPDLNSGASSVSFDNAGTGGSATNSSGSVSTPLSCTGTQTIGASASIMVAAATFSLVGGGGATGNTQITVSGQPMQSIGTVQLSSVTEFIEFFILWNPPVGSSLTVNATAYAFSGGVGSVSFESASYIGATSASTLITNSGSGTSLSLSVPAAIAGTRAVAAFTAGDVTTKANTVLSSYTKTQRGNTTVQVDSTQYGYQSLAFGDTAGTSGGVTFGATGADSFAEWAGAGIILSATSVVGSGGRAIATGGSVTSATSGTHTFAIFNSGTFTSDYSYNTSTCTLTVDNAGWYAVKISLLTDNYTSFTLGPVLYQNGSAAQYGISIAPTSGCIIGDTFLVYCNPGDTLTPGYNAGTTFSTTFAAETTGTKTYFEVALLNRSLL